MPRPQLTSERMSLIFLIGREADSNVLSAHRSLSSSGPVRCTDHCLPSPARRGRPQRLAPESNAGWRRARRQLWCAQTQARDAPIRSMGRCIAVRRSSSAMFSYQSWGSQRSDRIYRFVNVHTPRRRASATSTSFAALASMRGVHPPLVTQLPGRASPSSVCRRL